MAISKSKSMARSIHARKIRREQRSKASHYRKRKSKVISVGDINELKDALNSLSEYPKKPQKSLNIKMTPKLFEREMSCYMESEEWLSLYDVYSQLVAKKPHYNLKKHGLKLEKYILLCSDSIEIRTLQKNKYNDNIYIRPKNLHTDIDMKKSSKSNDKIVKGGFLRKQFSRVISSRIRLLEKRDRENSDEKMKLQIENSSNKSEIVKLTEEKDIWKKRHDSLRKEKRDEETSHKDSLIKSLRHKNLLFNKKIRELELYNESISSFSESSIESVPQSIIEVLEISEKNLTSLRFFEDAKKSAKNSPYHRPNLILKSLNQMDEAAKKWFAMESGSGSYESLLRDSYTLDIAESDSVKRNFGTTNIFGGWSIIEMKAHVKFGVQRDPKKTLRIYYKTDRERKLIYIGWCGQHP